MNCVVLGKTGISVNKNGFGALPIQRVEDFGAAAEILVKAYENGIGFFDTARFYTDSEEKLGYALSHVRDRIIIATKTSAATPEQFRRDLETSLSLLRTDHIDIYQFHNPSFCPKPGDGTGVYEEMQKARERGEIRFIGISNHRLDVAEEAVTSGLYDTLQFPFSYLSGEKELSLVKLCERENVGFIAMKALSGGLITDSAAAYAFLSQYCNVLPIWGIQNVSELDEFLSYNENPPEMTDAVINTIENDLKQLNGDFCRGCGYCMPCPAEINIMWCARMSLLLRRSPTAGHLGEKTRAIMKQTESCTRCGECVKKCPYGLDTPELLARNYEDYKGFIKM